VTIRRMTPSARAELARVTPREWSPPSPAGVAAQGGSDILPYRASAIAALETVEECKDIHDKAAAVALFYRNVKAGLQAQNDAAEIRIRCERRIGELAKEMDTEAGQRTDLTSSHNGKRLPKAAQLEQAGIATTTAHRYERLAEQPAEAFEAKIAAIKGAKEELTTASMLRPRNCRTNISRDTEWYTPPEIIELARQVLGTIDLDPASSAMAQETVQAEKFFTAEDDGLAQDWHGRVWLNPPFGRPLLGQFVSKACAEIAAGRVAAMIMLTPNSTDAGWFHEALATFNYVCFPRGRLGFTRLDGNVIQPTQGQAFFYHGPGPERFTAVFGKSGAVMEARNAT